MDVSPNYANKIIYYFIYAASAFSVYFCCKVITKKKAVFADVLLGIDFWMPGSI